MAYKGNAPGSFKLPLSVWPKGGVHHRAKFVAALTLAAAVFALPQVHSYSLVMLYGVAMGISGGVVTVVFFSVWSQVFGRNHLGRIQGFAQMMTVFALAAGPLLLAKTFQETGSYDAMFYALSAVVAILGVSSWFVGLPVRSPAPLPLHPSASLTQ